MNNIKLRKDNFVVDSGYFYTFDDDQDAILQKTADGNTAFSYPLDTVLNDQVKSLEYDGINFWTMETSTDNIYIKRWRIDNYISKLQDSFHYESTGIHIYDTDCFTVEHYHTKLTTTVSGGSIDIFIDEYSNVPDIIEDAKLFVGPNVNGEHEDVEVDHSIFGGVHLKTPLKYQYDIADSVNFHRRLWVFNNNNGNDTSTGALYKFDSHTGGYMDKYPGGAYKDIKACTFYKIKSFKELGPKDMLLYVKGTNTLFVNVSDKKVVLYDATSVNDDFNSGSLNPVKWDIFSGSPSIVNNQLELSVTTSGTVESIKTKYYLSGDFDVNIVGVLDTYDINYTGDGYQENFIKLNYPNEQNSYCKIACGYNNEFDSSLGHAFSAITYTTSGTVVNSAPLPNNLNYGLRLRRVESDIHLYYTTMVSGVYAPWTRLSTVSMFDSMAQLILESNNTSSMAVVNLMDNFEFTEGNIAYTSPVIELPYYGSMVMENVADDNYTVITEYDLSIDRNNLYRLESQAGTYSYALSPLESFVTSISLSASPAVIAANGLSTSDIKAWVKDQFLQPIAGRRISFSVPANGGPINPADINTDDDGFAQTEYTASTDPSLITITASVQQTN
jgi:hypothetical protein